MLHAPKNSSRIAPRGLTWLRAAGLAAIASIGAVGLIAACSEQPKGTCDVAGVCTGGVDPKPDSGVALPDTFVPDVQQPPPDAPALCDLSASRKDSLPCVDDMYGVFVSAAADDATATGTKAKPFKTIGKAVLGVDGKARIYVCAGIYNEAVVLTAPISIYGGFDCASWKFVSSINVQIKSPALGEPVLSLSAPAASAQVVAFEDLVLAASEGKAEGGASVVALLARSKAVFRSVQFSPGSGGDAKGATTEPVAGGAALNGVTPAAAVGGAGGTNACGAVTTNGGVGGAGGVAMTPVGFPGGNGMPNMVIGAGGVVAACDAASPAGNGKDGTAGAPGTTPPPGTVVGVLSAAGFVGTGGVLGTAGAPGNGGGGGAGGAYTATGTITGSAGGGGGAGGCGGRPSQPGGAGGSSIGIIAFESGVRLESCSMILQPGKPGAAGLSGQIGQPGGTGAEGAAVTCKGSKGGAGGAGGKGATSGGGAGGLSVGVLYSGATDPVFVNIDPVPGAFGVGGASPVAGLSGPNGVAAKMLKLP